MVGRRVAAGRPAAGRAVSSEAADLLRRVLELEMKRGCDDRAVVGGLDRYLDRARQERAVVRLLAAAPALVRGYASLDKPARERWIKAVLSGHPAKAPAKKASDEKAPSTTKTVPRADKPSTPAAPSDPLDQPVTVVKGVKAGLQARLAKLGVRSVRDLVYLFPNRHNDFASIRPIADLEPGEEQTTVVSVWSAKVARLGARYGAEAVVGDQTGTMRVVWFNQPYLAEQLQTNDRIVLSGKVSVFNGGRTMESPEWERLGGDDLTHTGRLVPVYPSTQGLSQRVLRRAVKEAVDRFAGIVAESLPAEVRSRHGLPGIEWSLRQMHYPDTLSEHEKARRRIAFEELLFVQLAVLDRRRAFQEGRAAALRTGGVIELYRSALPFALTGAQERVLKEISQDLESTRPMARLLQGDVGSGKTAVAGAALAVAVANGFQGTLMAPTEILAEQHYRTLVELLGRVRLTGRPPLRVELLTGSVRAPAKRGVVKAIASGEVDVAVGTHALIQQGVTPKRLGLAIVDEQHRFGVIQRAALRELAAEKLEQTPHLLVMSATPIPRTLALTFYGDLDLSVIDEMPPGRLPVKTLWVAPDERADSYRFVRQQVAEGRQAFVVCPLIEESQAVQSRAATQEYERLSREVFPELRLGLLHGRMSSAEKDAVLGSFRNGDMQVLVSTTVIEVGIDIPNATVMLIEGADRFGLAQLHQLRGRVGRGADQSFCLLLSDDPSEIARRRLKLMEETNDGFVLAEADLQLRGPGDVLGTRQSGLPEELHAADFSDVRLIEEAREEARALLNADPGLRRPEHAALAAGMARMKRVVTGEVS